MPEKTLLDLVIDGLVDAGVFAFETEAAAEVEAEMGESLKATLSIIGYDIPAFSNSIHFHVIDLESEDDAQSEAP